jgi:hypothetical protein
MQWTARAREGGQPLEEQPCIMWQTPLNDLLNPHDYSHVNAVHIVSFVPSMLATLHRGGGVETMCRAHPRAWVSEPSEAKLLEGTQRWDGTRPWAHGCCWHVRHDFALSSATVLAAPISVSRCGRHPGTPPMVVSRSTLAALHGRPRLASYRPCGRGRPQTLSSISWRGSRTAPRPRAGETRRAGGGQTCSQTPQYRLPS